MYYFWTNKDRQLGAANSSSLRPSSIPKNLPSLLYFFSYRVNRRASSKKSSLRTPKSDDCSAESSKAYLNPRRANTNSTAHAHCRVISMEVTFSSFSGAANRLYQYLRPNLSEQQMSSCISKSRAPFFSHASNGLDTWLK
jgi:hypothetical protein